MIAGREAGQRVSSRGTSKTLVQPNGCVETSGPAAWFQPGKFRFCPACGEVHGQSGRDINRLAGLTAEGRSSATTVLVSSILRSSQEPASSGRLLEIPL